MFALQPDQLLRVLLYVHEREAERAQIVALAVQKLLRSERRTWIELSWLAILIRDLISIIRVQIVH